MTVAPAGRRLFAPQARLVDLESGEPIGAGAPADTDLVSVKVTQVHSDVSLLSLTMNNQRNVGGRPVHPPWKYNDLQTLRFGQRVRVDFRYGSESWVPMIAARITDITFSFPQSGGARLTLAGEDFLSLLKRKDTRDKRYRNQDEVAIVRDLLGRSSCGLGLADPLVPRESFSDSLGSVTHQKSQTYLQFIQSLAQRLDYEVFVDFDDPTDPASEVKFHFEPSRSLALNQIVDVEWTENLIAFNPKFKVWEQFTGAVARGRHPRNRRRIEEDVAAEAVIADLHADPHAEREPRLLNAIEARQIFFAEEGHGEENPEPVDVSNLDRDRARVKAAAVLRARAREFLTAEGSTIGLPQLRPGVHVNIKEMRAPFDGLYYVTRAIHSLDDSGYRTEFSVRRPGMLHPEDYPAAREAGEEAGA
jgi:phage protein D